MLIPIPTYRARNPWSRSDVHAFTLLELLVVLAVVALLIGLILPAVQSARESSRRAQCLDNLRQLALAAQNYHDSIGTYPMGTPVGRWAESSAFVGHSTFVALLPYLEQQSMYNSVNFSANIYVYSNNTIHGMAYSSLWCPSDLLSGRIHRFASAYEDMPPNVFLVAYSNYAACTGVFYHLSGDLAVLRELNSQDYGMCFANSSVNVSQVTDGSSCTILFGERYHGQLSGDPSINSHWWFDGYFGDTLFWSLSPINPGRLIPFDQLTPDEYNPQVVSASSLHPGGANFAFVDGSARFIKDSIDSWPIDPATSFPTGVTGDSSSLYAISAGTRMGLYQALTTRNGSELIPGDY